MSVLGSNEGIASVMRRRARRLEHRAHAAIVRWPTRVQCPICGWRGARFAASHKPRRKNRLCPVCRSSERDRAFELLLQHIGPVAPGTRLLEIAPIGTIRPTAERLGYTYVSLDLESPIAAVLGDLTALPFADGAFGLVVCFHVLEHVVADDEGVRELARVTAADGSVCVVVPRDRDLPTTFEPAAPTEADRIRLFGQHDHVRMYGADVASRWQAAGVDVTETAWADLFAPDVHRRAVLGGNDDRFWMIRSSVPAEAPAT